MHTTVDSEAKNIHNSIHNNHPQPCATHAYEHKHRTWRIPMNIRMLAYVHNSAHLSSCFWMCSATVASVPMPCLSICAIKSRSNKRGGGCVLLCRDVNVLELDVCVCICVNMCECTRLCIQQQAQEINGPVTWPSQRVGLDVCVCVYVCVCVTWPGQRVGFDLIFSRQHLCV
jgi:hypothetical protein